MPCGLRLNPRRKMPKAETCENCGRDLPDSEVCGHCGHDNHRLHLGGWANKRIRKDIAEDRLKRGEK